MGIGVRAVDAEMPDAERGFFAESVFSGGSAEIIGLKRHRFYRGVFCVEKFDSNGWSDPRITRITRKGREGQARVGIYGRSCDGGQAGARISFLPDGRVAAGFGIAESDAGKGGGIWGGEGGGGGGGGKRAR